MEAALDYLRRMFDDQLEPDVKLYNTLSTCRHTHLLLLLLPLCPVTDHGGLAVACLLAPVWGHCKRMEYAKAVRILRLMESKAVAPDMLTYSYLISCHVDCNQLDEAKQLYTEMRERLIR